MLCLSCHGLAGGRLCSGCLSTLRPAPERLILGEIRLVAPFAHEGAARRLMHLFKYQGVPAYAEVVAGVLADWLPVLPLVPVPRSLSRRLRYGVDPALMIARAISARNGAPVVRILIAPLHSRRRAGGDHGLPAAEFSARASHHRSVILVDDVVTTGATLAAAARAVGVERVALAAAANSVAGVSSLHGT